MLATTSTLTKQTHTADEAMDLPAAKRARVEPGSSVAKPSDDKSDVEAPTVESTTITDQSSTDSQDVGTSSATDEKAEEPEPERDFHGKRLEVWWEFGDIKVWWGCTAKEIEGKTDKKNRQVYSLHYDARPDLGYDEELRSVIFTCPRLHLLRDIKEKTIMLFRDEGDKDEPTRIYIKNEQVIVQTVDDSEEWQPALVECIEEDGSYTVRIEGHRREAHVHASRIEEAPPPRGLPRSKLLKQTDRFIQKGISFCQNAPQFFELSKEQQRSAINIVRNRKSNLIDTLLGTIGTFDDVSDYDHAISNLDQEAFFKENFLPRLDEAIQRVKEGDNGSVVDDTEGQPTADDSSDESDTDETPAPATAST
eukprot:m.1602713 g.1602713  ORF g.1602713 m.1602713 type:complete len:365 (-) comp25354_c0_seq1:15710-16804(-)